MSTTDQPFSPRYHSIVERVTLLSPAAFEQTIDWIVLLKLAWYSDFKTGVKAHPKHETLAKECGCNRRTIIRSLLRLEAGGWIAGTRWHRHATTYALALDRLPVSHPRFNLSDTRVTLNQRLGDTDVTLDQLALSDTAVTQDALSDQGVTQLSDSGVTPIPCTEIPKELSTSAPPSDSGPTHEERLAAQGQLAGLLRTVLQPPEPPTTRVGARRIAKVFRGLMAKPHKWTDAGDAKEALRQELGRLQIGYTPADIDDAISWVDASVFARQARAG